MSEHVNLPMQGKLIMVNNVQKTPNGMRADEGEIALIAEPGEGKVFARNAIKHHAGREPEHIRWLCATLDGVNVYFDGKLVTVTRKNLYP